MKTITHVRSSNGALIIGENGMVQSCDANDDEDGQHLRQIVRFDVDEWKRYHKRPTLPGSLDILDLGYTYAKPMGETGGVLLDRAEPDAEWRQMMKEMYPQEELPL